MTENTETQTVALEYELPHSPAKVWRALTDPTLLGQWLMSTDMQPVVGRPFTFRMEPTQWWDGIVNCQVQEIDTHKRLRYTWASGPDSSPLDTVVTWTLTPTPTGGTMLQLVHSGFVAGNKFAYSGALDGWKHRIGVRLADVLQQTTEHEAAV